MKKAGHFIPVVLVSLVLWCPGCKRSGKPPAQLPDRLVRTAPTWGRDIEGLQCRLRPTKRLWNAGESVTFRLDLRNRGKRLFAFDASQPIRAQRISLDGRWYRWSRSETAAAKVRSLAPGDELADLSLALPRTLRLPLTPGYHTLAVAFMFEGAEVVSNPVTIEIAAPGAAR